MRLLGLGSPDKVPPLTEKAAIELGGDILAEFFVFGTAAGAILLEYLRQSSNKTIKDNALAQTVTDLVETQGQLVKKLESNNERIAELTKYAQDQKQKIDDLNAKLAKLNARANIKSATQGSQTTQGRQIGKVIQPKSSGRKASEDVKNSMLFQTAENAADSMRTFSFEKFNLIATNPIASILNMGTEQQTSQEGAKSTTTTPTTTSTTKKSNGATDSREKSPKSPTGTSKSNTSTNGSSTSKPSATTKQTATSSTSTTNTTNQHK